MHDVSAGSLSIIEATNRWTVVANATVTKNSIRTRAIGEFRQTTNCIG